MKKLNTPYRLIIGGHGFRIILYNIYKICLKLVKFMSKVTDIVNNIKAMPSNSDELAFPKIVNKSSNFVVVTYWWGA